MRLVERVVDRGADGESPGQESEDLVDGELARGMGLALGEGVDYNVATCVLAGASSFHSRARERLKATEIVMDKAYIGSSRSW